MPTSALSTVPLHDLISLADRVAVITGGARGIGLAIARRFAEAGASLVLADRDLPAAEEAAASFGESTRAVALALDATDPDAHESVADRTVEELGGLHIWVNNAGVYPFTPACEMDDAEWRLVVDLNLSGTFYGARAAARRMSEGGVILNLASTAGYGGGAVGLAHYSSTKHAVRGLTKNLAIELGPLGIRVLALAPGGIATEGTAELSGVEATEEFEFGAENPLGRGGRPDDVARVALFCASGLAGFVTGDTILVDGGARAR